MMLLSLKWNHHHIIRTTITTNHHSSYIYVFCLPLHLKTKPSEGDVNYPYFWEFEDETVVDCHSHSGQLKWYLPTSFQLPIGGGFDALRCGTWTKDCTRFLIKFSHYIKIHTKFFITTIKEYLELEGNRNKEETQLQTWFLMLMWWDFIWNCLL